MQLDQYQLLARLAVGGMAELHVARAHTAAGVERLVVVKQMLPELAVNPSYVQMFFDEGRVIAALNHSNVVQLYDMGMQAGIPYLVLEYLRGHTLASLLDQLRSRGRTLSVAHALSIASAVCAGLHHAHAARDMVGQDLGIVHRDVSPQNIVITYDGAVKLIDFGIAKASGQAHATDAGTLKGKLYYMAPEQVRTRAVDRRTDLYAVGVVLFEMLALKIPYDLSRYEPGSELSIMMAIANGELIALRDARPDAPAELEREIRRAMSVDPAARHADAHQLQSALDAIGRAHGADVQPADRAALVEELFGPFRPPWAEPAPVAADPARPDTGEVTVAKAAPADAAPAPAGDAAAVPRPSTTPPRLPPAPGRISWSRFALIGGVVVTLAAGGTAWLVRGTRPAAAPVAIAPPPGDAGVADAHAARIARDEAIVLAVEPDGAWSATASATAADTDQAIDATRDRFLQQVAIRLLADLPATLAPCRGPLRDPAAIGARWRHDVGGFAMPERSQLEVDDGPPAAASARYTLSAEAQHRAHDYYARMFTGWQLSFANAAPDREPGVIIVESAHPAIPVGSVLTAVDGEAVKNLGELADHGAASVELTLRAGDRTWTAKVP